VRHNACALNPKQMINPFKFYITLSLIAVEFCNAQADKITIDFIANAGLHITDGRSDIYFDFPYKSGAHHYMKYDPAEITKIRDSSVFIFTHKHSDHYSRRLVKRTRGKVYTPWNAQKLGELNHSVNNFNIQFFRTSHRFSFRHCSYLISWHGVRIFISGDTGASETIVAADSLDWAFIPVWLLIDAKKKNTSIRTQMTGIYHIGPRDKITTTNPKILLLDKQGEKITIPFKHI
jgi:hypothetical protein